jgi:hypothetical protein
VGGPWIPSRDAAGRSLPGILIAFVFAVAVVVGFVIGFLPDCHVLRALKAGLSETRLEQDRTADGPLLLNVECDNPTRILTVCLRGYFAAGDTNVGFTPSWHGWRSTWSGYGSLATKGTRVRGPFGLPLVRDFGGSIRHQRRKGRSYGSCKPKTVQADKARFKMPYLCGLPKTKKSSQPVTEACSS